MELLLFLLTNMYHTINLEGGYLSYRYIAPILWLIMTRERAALEEKQGLTINEEEGQEQDGQVLKENALLMSKGPNIRV